MAARTIPSRFLIIAAMAVPAVGMAAGSAPVLSELKMLETSPDPAEVYFSFVAKDPDADLDLMGDASPIRAGVFCDRAGFAGTAFGKAEKYDAKTGLTHFRATYRPHRGVGECSFTLVVKDKAGNESAPIESKVTFEPVSRHVEE